MIDTPHLQFLAGFRANLIMRSPEYHGKDRVLLGAIPAISKDDCPRMCLEFLTDSTEAMSASRSRRVAISANIQFACYEWADDDAGIHERMLRKYWSTHRTISAILREMRLGTNCPDGLVIHGAGNILGATAAIPVNCRSQALLYAYNIPNLTFEATIGED